MATTQSNLHQFYKARKSARDTVGIKNAKNSISKVQSDKHSEVLSLKGTENVADSPATKIEAPVQQAPIKGKLQFKTDKSSNKRNEKPRSRPTGAQDIAAMFQRVAAKRKREEEEEVTENDRSIISSLTDVCASPPVTPKRKTEEGEDETKKRRKQGNSDLDRTPSGEDVSNQHDPPKSAKKKLLMDARGPPEMKENSTDKVQDDNIQKSRKILSPRKLTPSEMKGHLGKCSRLSQLRAKLLKVNQCEEKVRVFRENNLTEQLRSTDVPSPSKTLHPQLEKFSSLDVEVPVSPRKTPVKTPVKTPLKRPAHERFQYLVEKPSEELVLPYKYRLVKEVFRAVDTVVSLLHNRQEVVTFSKLKSAVQEMLRKAFSEHHLGEIKTVFPLAYIFKQESMKNTGKSVMSNGPSAGYQLTINANMDYKSAAQNLMNKFDSDSGTQTPKFRKMDSVVMVERRNIFHNSLINIVREHHTEFLKSLDPPIINCDSNIKRWHLDFPLEDIDGIEPSPLPQPPVTDKIDTAQDLLSKAHDLFSVNARLEKAVVDAAARTPKKEVAEKQQEQAPPANIAAALKGVSASLLEKIRAREAAKATREMTRTSYENKELEMLSRLPEISRIIRNIFITEKKAALSWETVSMKISASYPSMLAGNEVDTHLNLLIKEVPGWCTVHKVRSGVFLKIDKNEPQSNITDKLQTAIKHRQ